MSELTTGMNSEETMEDYKEQLERSFRTLTEGDVVTGTIISITEEEIFIDLQYYTQGILPVSEVSEDPTFVIDEHYAIGDEIKATITSMDDGNGNIKLSVKEAAKVLAWDVLREIQEKNEVITVKVTEAVNAGVITYVEGIRAFIPASQLSVDYVEDTSEWVGKTLEVKLITIEEEKQKLILSSKVVMKERQEGERRQKISHLVPGSVLEGTVESIMPYGAFIHLGDGLSGLVHISRICQKRIKNPSEVLKVGEKVKVKLIDCKDDKISLSMKEFEEILEAQVDDMETFDYKETGEATTTLGDLFKNIKF